MTREEAIRKMAIDMTDNMSLDDMHTYISESLEFDLTSWPKEDLIEEWEMRDLAVDITDSNPFKE